MKITKSIRFPNQDENTGKLNSKSKFWNKKNKNKNMTSARQKSNKILLQEWNKNKTKFWQRNVPKTTVKQTKSNKDPTSIYAPCTTPNSRMLPWKFHVWPMSIDVAHD